LVACALNVDYEILHDVFSMSQQMIRDNLGIVSIDLENFMTMNLNGPGGSRVDTGTSSAVSGDPGSLALPRSLLWRPGTASAPNITPCSFSPFPWFSSDLWEENAAGTPGTEVSMPLSPRGQWADAGGEVGRPWIPPPSRSSCIWESLPCTARELTPGTAPGTASGMAFGNDANNIFGRVMGLGEERHSKRREVKCGKDMLCGYGKV
jgi:hypothetical protein